MSHIQPLYSSKEGVMEVLVERALRAIAQQAPRREEALRAEIDTALEQLEKRKAQSTAGPENEDADQYFRPFHVACEVPNPKIRAIALDAIEKLVAWGNLTGTLRVMQDGKERFLIDLVVESVCKCRDDGNDGVQLQVIKALLTLVSTATCQVGEGALLEAVRSVYQIYLVARTPVNRSTAKVTLTQMLGIVFQRMETYDERVRQGLPPPVPPLSAEARRQRIAEQKRWKARRAAQQAEHAGAGEAKAGEEGGQTAGGAEAGSAEAQPAAAAGEQVEEAARPDTNGAEAATAENEGAEEATAAAAAADTDAAAAAAAAADADAGAAEERQEEEEEERPAAAAAAAAAAASAGGCEEEGVKAGYSLDGFPSPYHKDAFLLFRALCNVSGNEEADGSAPAAAFMGGTSATDSQPVRLKAQLLSLELILSILDSAGRTFRTYPRFVSAIRRYLAMPLLKHFLSAHPSVVSLSLRIFMVLVKSFRSAMQGEIEIFISNIFLRILQSENAGFEQKQQLLAVFRQMCEHPEVMLELFYNYDLCDGREDVLERVVGVIASVAQGRASAAITSTQRTAAEGAALRRSALECIATIAESTAKAAVSARGVADDDEDESASEAGAAAAAAAGAGAAAAGAAVADGNDEDGDEGVEPASSEPRGGPMPPDSPMSTASGVAASGGARHSIAETYERQRRRRAELARAALKFKMKPKAGVKYLQELGRCGTSAEEVAACLYELRELLDKTQIGDYMGEGKDFNVAVLHAYVEALDFRGLSFDVAIRRFLSGFRLPGEAQKIDRMMEKFAEVFVRHNPGVFPAPEADTAFVLGYSVIMLNTDAHNPGIPPEKKMTKQGFLRNNSGIAGGQDLPQEFLEGIYDSIVSDAISLKEDDDLRQKEATKQATSLRARQQLAVQEREELLKATAQRMLDGGAGSRAGAEVQDDRPPLAELGLGARGEVVSVLFECVWGAVMAVFAVSFEASSDNRAVQLCLHGLRRSIRAAGLLGRETERDALVTALTRFTGLLSGASWAQGPLQPKNVVACQAVVRLAVFDGEQLGDSWQPVLECVSEIARLHVSAAGALQDAAYFPDSMPPGGARRRAASRSAAAHNAGGGSGMTAAERAHAERLNAAHVRAAVSEGELGRVYTNSAKLSEPAVEAFVTALCSVAMRELQLSGLGAAAAAAGGSQQTTPGSGGPSAPRIYSLQKVVEVADFNLAQRGRIVWGRIWRTLSRLFTAVGCHSNAALSMYAIDSLKQLSAKFLTKPELAAFHFQRVFLAPFAAIMEAQPKAAPEVRHLILDVFAHLVQSRWQNIRSGWQTIFAVHASAAADPLEELSKAAFSTVCMIADHHGAAVARAGAFTEMLNCIVAFVLNRRGSKAVSLAAIDRIKLAAEQLMHGGVPAAADPAAAATPLPAEGADTAAAPGPVAAVPPQAAAAAVVQFDDRRAHTANWWPLLMGLMRTVGDQRLEVRTKALATLMDTLLAAGSGFSPALWNLIYTGILLPMFDDVRSSSDQRAAAAERRARRGQRAATEEHELTWLTTTCLPALQGLVTLHATFHAQLKPMVPWLLNLIRMCVVQGVEGLARIGVAALHQLLSEAGDHLDDEDWGLVCEAVEQFTSESRPSALLESKQHLLGEELAFSDDEGSASGGAAASGVTVMTVYGAGQAEQVPVAGARCEVRFAWGTLYAPVGSGVEAVEAEAAAARRAQAQQSPESMPAPPLPFDATYVVTQCVVQLRLIEAVGEIVRGHAAKLGVVHVRRLIAVLEDAAVFAREFNADRRLRRALWRAGFMKHAAPGDQHRLPSLLGQERLATTQLVGLLLRLLARDDSGAAAGSETRLLARSRLRSLAVLVVERYQTLDASSVREQAELRALAGQRVAAAEVERQRQGVYELQAELGAYHPIVLELLRGLLDCDATEFQLQLHWLYPLLAQLIACGDHKVRQALAEVFQQRIPPLLDIPPAPEGKAAAGAGGAGV